MVEAKKNSKTADPNVGVGVSPYKIVIPLNEELK
jgi:hypothetical protein